MNRSNNFSEVEKQLLLNLVSKYKNIIENKDQWFPINNLPNYVRCFCILQKQLIVTLVHDKHWILLS